jgi:hypothetical protein
MPSRYGEIHFTCEVAHFIAYVIEGFNLLGLIVEAIFEFGHGAILSLICME